MAGKREDYIERIHYHYKDKRKVFQIARIADTLLQTIVVGGAAAVPILLLISSIPKTIPTVISGIVAVTAALANYYKLGERSRIHRTTSEALGKEIDRYELQIKPYKGLNEDQAFDLFVENTEIVLEEHVKQIFSMKSSYQPQQIEIKKESLS